VALRQEEFTSLCDDVDLGRDRLLVERCQAGDSAAYGNLYARYNERLLRFCLRRLNDRHEAEDAAQEAFARAWKALPNFAGERRFYPWLTVIAGNICTDMLRRRSRSTPTDDLELTLCQPVGSTAEVGCDEMLIAAVDGELVHEALDRLSVRHRHVLALREGSGLTYQQIADEEGVEIGTIETLLWRARQALKREFTVLSESKGALAGFLIGAGVFARKGLMRIAPRNAALQAGMSPGTLRNAFAGAALTSAAVAAAIVAPHALSGSHHAAPAAPFAVTALSHPAATGGAGAAGGTPSVTPPPTGTTPSGGTGGSSDSQGGGDTGSIASILGTASSATPPTGLALPPVGSAAGVPLPAVTGSAPVQGVVKSLTSGLGAAAAQGVSSASQPLATAVGGTVQTVGSGLTQILSTIAGGGAAVPSTDTSSGATSPVVPSTTVPTLPSPASLSGVTQTLTNPLKSLR
jgi:RNA polymerase sigma-70 factor (ECF subfamily)